MKQQFNTSPAHAALTVSLAVLFVSAGSPALSAAYGLTQKPNSPTADSVKSQAATDYLVQMGDHIMWASQVGKMHPELAKKAGSGDYPVQVGKHSMLKSQVGKMHPELAKKEKLPAGKTGAGDYPVQVGKHTMQKSKVGEMHPELAPKGKVPGKQNTGDYPVQVGKHTMQKSQVGKMHPELVKKGKSLSDGLGNDFLVQIGGESVLASTLRRVDGPNSTRPAPQDATATDYRVQYGEKTVWASEITAPYPAGKGQGEQKPLYLVVPL